MNNIINEMLSNYRLGNEKDKKNAIKEIIQEIVLSGLSRAGFFNVAAFYGGTSLRIFHGLDRFSEDLDFSLLEKDDDFDFSKYFNVLEKELISYGLNMQIELKNKSAESVVKSAFVKGNTKEMILHFYADELWAEKTIFNETIKVKFEVDTNPAGGSNYEIKYKTIPSPYYVRIFDLPSLFAGKVAAVLTRAWKSRIKGRDLYDFIFYSRKRAKINIQYLKAQLIQTGYLQPNDEFDINALKLHLYKRFDQIDYESAKKDVIDFIENQEQLDIWGSDFFKSLVDSISE